MRILTVNAGSTSVKLERYDLDAPLPELAAPPAPNWATETTANAADEALADALGAGVDAVAHRFVRLPDDAPAVLRLDADAMQAIERIGGEAPLHDAAALHAVMLVRRQMPAMPQLAVADGAFHRTMSDAATTYAIPRELTRRGLRRRGYHGLSHEYAAHRACALAGIDIGHARVVTAHLGGGSSLCAIDGGRSIDTTMGYTPLEGLPMATRSGSVDPGLLLHLLREGMTPGELEDILERRSGLLGISGRTGDVRALLAATDDPDVGLALDVLAWRLRAAVGAMIAVLGGIELLVFTGGIGEHAAEIRAAGVLGAVASGAELDTERNPAMAIDGLISTDASRVAVFVVSAREGWHLARRSYRALENPSS
ncbi:MAG: acetate/propionate family kinase [Candidatus Eremiobacteraeota bacterium]|nr:acetate/propionate family kinase [Candidatus Eremiobacteraeota bacterium]